MVADGMLQKSHKLMTLAALIYVSKLKWPIFRLSDFFHSLHFFARLCPLALLFPKFFFQKEKFPLEKSHKNFYLTGFIKINMITPSLTSFTFHRFTKILSHRLEGGVKTLTLFHFKG